MKNHIKTILFYLVVIALIIVVVSVIFQSTSQEKLVLADVVTYFEKDRVESFIIDEDYNLIMQVIKLDENGGLVEKNGEWETTEISYRLQSLGLFQEYCGEYVKTNTRLATYDIEPEATVPWWVSLLPGTVIIIVFVVLWFLMMRSAGGGSKLKRLPLPT